MIVVHETDEAQAKALEWIWVDKGYQDENFVRMLEQLCGAKVEVVKRSEVGFVLLPKQ